MQWQKQVVGGALPGSNLTGEKKTKQNKKTLVSLICRVKASAAQARPPEGSEKMKLNKSAHAGEQEKGTGDTAGVKFYQVPLPSLWNAAWAVCV